MNDIEKVVKSLIWFFLSSVCRRSWQSRRWVKGSTKSNDLKQKIRVESTPVV